MSENAFLTWFEILQDKILSAIDNVIATPVNNLMHFLSIEWQKPAPGVEVKNPYPFINKSEYATDYKELVLVSAILSVIVSIVISVYKSVRDKERISNYFFFERLFSLVGNNNEASINLRTAAYFYNPDVSPMALWLRRAWASLMGNSDLKNLEKYLTKTKNTKEILLKEMYKKINEQLASFITNKERYGKWVVEEQAGKWRLKPPAESLEAWRQKKEEQEKGDSTHSIGEKTKKMVLSHILSIIKLRLDELGRASFVYWIGVFTFYFFPGTAVVGGIVWPPILIAGIFLVAIWTIKNPFHENKQPKLDVSDKKKAQKTTSEYIEGVKYQIQLDALLEREKIHTFNYENNKFKKPLKESKLYRNIRDIINSKSNLRRVRAFFNGFIVGCFIIFFSSWLLNAATLCLVGLFITLSSETLAIVAAVVALTTLVLGVAYGIYFAALKNNEELKKISNTKTKFLKLQEKCGDVEVPDISLRECDRLFRCGTTKPSVWTLIKQGSKRAWTGFIRLGTGMLFFKLLPLGTTLAVLGALNSSVVAVPVFVFVIMVAVGLVFAGCHIWQYHCGSKEDQAVRIMDFFLNRHYDLKSSHSSYSLIRAEKKKDDSRGYCFDALLNANKVFSYKFLLRRISSEPRLNDLNLNGMQGPTETDSNDRNILLESEDYIPQRKRSDTFPGTAISERREKNEAIVPIDDPLNKKIENKSESPLNANKNGPDKILVRRISSQSCLDVRDLEDAKNAKIIQNSEASIPQRKRSGTLPASFGRKRKVCITTNYNGTLKPGTRSF